MVGSHLADGEVARRRLALSLSRLGQAFLEVDEHLWAGDHVAARRTRRVTAQCRTVRDQGLISMDAPGPESNQRDAVWETAGPATPGTLA